ncbi:hypothetical protein [uncultured Arcobacter sp.]|uniref:hypothetical protein n=1 Tax=uncultured Arcobacter sp. TaxID=165434 RepID=UPI002623EEC3|nr:hypothetical protein [uncultured Arcobacter sp.]
MIPTIFSAVCDMCGNVTHQNYTPICSHIVCYDCLKANDMDCPVCDNLCIKQDVGMKYQNKDKEKKKLKR